MRIRLLAVGIYVYDWLLDCGPSWDMAYKEACEYYG